VTTNPTLNPIFTETMRRSQSKINKSKFLRMQVIFPRFVYRPMHMIGWYTGRKNNKPKTVRSDRQQAGTLQLAVNHCKENSLSLIVSDLPTDCRAYLQRLTDS